MQTKIILIGIIVIDFVSKLIAPSIGNVNYNTGLAFGIAAGRLTAIFLTAVILAVVFFYYFLHHSDFNKTQNVSMALIMGGALSNFFERIFFGHVTDFIFLANGILNFADVAIFTGMAILLFSEFAKIVKLKTGKLKSYDNKN